MARALKPAISLNVSMARPSLNLRSHRSSLYVCYACCDAGSLSVCLANARASLDSAKEAEMKEPKVEHIWVFGDS